MKKTFFLPFVILAAQVATAQIKTVNGSISDESGNPISYVFIQQGQTANATFTDSVGNFTVKVNPAGVLKFDADGFADNLTPVDQINGDLKITLKSLGTATAAAGNLKTNTTVNTTPQSALSLNGSDVNSFATGGGMTAPGHKKGNLHGNRYLFDDFVHGYVIANPDGGLRSPDCYYDYDKISGELLFSKDKTAINQLTDDQVKEFALFGNGKLLLFKKIPAVDKARYVQILADGPKYTIVKLTNTTFHKSDYETNGISSHGNDYDEYVDEYIYYVVNAQTGAPVKISLRKKSIKEAFVAEADKINKYLTTNSGDIDDAYLSGLGDYMNQ